MGKAWIGLAILGVVNWLWVISTVLWVMDWRITWHWQEKESTQALTHNPEDAHKRQAWAEKQIDWCVPGAILQWDDAAHIPTCTIPNKD